MQAQAGLQAEINLAQLLQAADHVIRHLRVFVHDAANAMADVLLEGKADAVLAASIFHFGEYTVGQVKEFLSGKGITVRRT